MQCVQMGEWENLRSNTISGKWRHKASQEQMKSKTMLCGWDCPQWQKKKKVLIRIEQSTEGKIIIIRKDLNFCSKKELCIHRNYMHVFCSASFHFFNANLLQNILYVNLSSKVSRKCKAILYLVLMQTVLTIWFPQIKGKMNTLSSREIENM